MKASELKMNGLQKVMALEGGYMGCVCVCGNNYISYPKMTVFIFPLSFEVLLLERWAQTNCLVGILLIASSYTINNIARILQLMDCSYEGRITESFI